MEVIKEALTFDDVLLVPRYSSVLPSETNLNIDLGNNLKLKIPFLSSAMDTVTESSMAIAISQKGGLGIIHRNLSINEQCKEVKKVKNKNLIVGAAVGTTNEDLLRTKSILDSGVDLIVIDTAHGHSDRVIKILSKIKKINLKKPICVGNIATAEAALKLYNEGADILKVGIGPGSICTTRMIAGIGMPKISEVTEVKKGKRTKKQKKYFPGYVLVKLDMTKQIYHLIKNLQKVSGFLGSGDTPTPIADKEIQRILGTVSESANNQKTGISFEIGEKVKVCDGPFASFNGLIEEIDEEKSRLKVSVSIFGRATPVDLEFNQVEKN